MPTTAGGQARLGPGRKSPPYAILESIKDPVHVIDRGYRVLWSNSFAAGDREYGPEHIVGKVCYRAFFNRSGPCPDCPLANVFASGRAGVSEKIILMPDGSRQRREVHAYPIAGPDGRADFVVKIGFDITGQKRSRTRLEKGLEPLEHGPPDWRGGPAKEAGARFGLTDRECEVLSLMARGFAQAKIAGLLGISPHTVKRHVVHVFEKLGINNRAQAGVWASRLGLV